jgi:putative endonuclease
MYFVYVIQSRKSKKLYIGVSYNLLRRLHEHNSPFNTGYTKNNQWEILYVEGYLKKDIAYHREKMLKQYGNVWQGVKKRINRTMG